jgi:hypothetical protein
LIVRYSFLSGILALGLCATAFADVSATQSITIDAGGVLGMMAADSEVETKISGDKSATTTTTTPRSTMVRAFGGGGTTQDIIRLDRGKIYNVDVDNKQYVEMTIEEQRARLEAGLRQMEEAQVQAGRSAGGGTGDAGLPVSEDNCEWQPAEMTTSLSDDVETIAGLQATPATYRVKQTCLDRETGKRCDFVWTMQQWMASNAPGAQELVTFYENYARAVGMEEFMAQTPQPGMASLFSTFQKGWEDVREQARQREGYPVKTVMEVEVGGDQCTFESGQQVASADIFGDAAEAGLEAGASSAASDASYEASREAAEAMGDSIGGRAAGSAAGAFGRKLAGGLMGKFRKKKEPEPEPAPATQPAAPGGMVRMFRITTTTDTISTAPIPAAAFEPPAGFRSVPPPPLPEAPAPNR